MKTSRQCIIYDTVPKWNNTSYDKLQYMYWLASYMWQTLQLNGCKITHKLLAWNWHTKSLFISPIWSQQCWSFNNLSLQMHLLGNGKSPSQSHCTPLLVFIRKTLCSCYGGILVKQLSFLIDIKNKGKNFYHKLGM